MSADVPVDEVARDLKGWLDQLSSGEMVRLTDSDGEPVAVVRSLKGSQEKPLTFEEWEKEWDALAERIEKAWKGDKSGLEELSDMRR